MRYDIKKFASLKLDERASAAVASIPKQGAQARTQCLILPTTPILTETPQISSR
jgi:hypothetical protein